MNELLDFLHIARYRENNRIEAKKAQGGLPHSLWETYSAFANTLGGVILLGVMEGSDHRFYSVPVDAAGLKKELVSQLKEGKIASVNLLKEEDVAVCPADGNEIVAVFVPRADRRERPVYIGSDPLTGTYLRDGEGDYRCPREVVLRMLEEQKRESPDGALLYGYTLSDLREEDISDYCRSLGREGSAERILLSLGALAGDSRGVFPTYAGLLFFGRGEALARRFPTLTLAFQGNGKIFSPKGENIWNLYRYARAVEGELTGFSRDRAVRAGLKEVLTNALVNADYERGGVSVSLFEEGAETVNAGSFSPSPERAVGGFSEPRNEKLSDLFSAMGWGSRAGGGLLRLYETWKERGLKLPTMEETVSPPSVSVTLWLTKDDGKPCTLGRAALFRLLLDYLTRRASATAAELAGDLHCSTAEADELLYEGARRRILVREGERWRLKERA